MPKSGTVSFQDGGGVTLAFAGFTRNKRKGKLSARKNTSFVGFFLGGGAFAFSYMFVFAFAYAFASHVWTRLQRERLYWIRNPRESALYSLKRYLLYACLAVYAREALSRGFSCVQVNPVLNHCLGGTGPLVVKKRSCRIL